MNIRIRKHNDMPKWIVVELIVDGEIIDDDVCMNKGSQMMISIRALLAANSPLKIKFEDNVDRSSDYTFKTDRALYQEINIVDPMS